MKATKKVTGLNLATIFIIGIFSLVVFYFYRPWGLYFLNDDLIHVPLSQQKVFGQNNSIRAGNDFSLFLDSMIFGKNATGYHITNLLIHCLSSFALYIYVRQLINLESLPRFKWLSLISAFLFFIYPFHSESVFWIIGRTGSLSTLLFFLSLIFFYNANKGFFYMIISVLLFAASLSVYESVWIFPIPLFWTIYFHFREGAQKMKSILGTAMAFCLVFIGFMIIRYQIQSEIVGAYEMGNVKNVSPIVNFGFNYGRLLIRSLMMPLNSTLFFLFMGMTLLIGLVIWIYFQLKSKEFTLWIWFPLSSFLFSLIPYITLGIDTHGTESERYLYLPSFFFCILLAVLLCSIKNEKNRTISLLIISVYFITALAISSKNYRVASSIVKSTFRLLMDVPDGHTVILKNVPRDNRGVVMFGLGIPEGFQWLSGKESKIKLLLENYSEDDRLFEKSNVLIKNESKPEIISGTFFDLQSGHNIFFKMMSNNIWVLSFEASGIVVIKNQKKL